MNTRPDPILLDLPASLETERLVLRVPRPGDGPVVYEGVRESLEMLRPWMIWAQGEQSVASAETFAREAAVQFLRREAMPLLIFGRLDGRFIGGHGINRMDWDVPAFEIGYWVRASEAGKGYITEATRAVTDFCFATLGAARVAIRCDARNRRSAAVAERCGFTLEVRLRRWARDARGELADHLVYSMIRSEWEAHQRPGQP
ncbi:MAG: GNAT family N-acetyltransferase [Anaerolineae bacterium]